MSDFPVDFHRFPFADHTQLEELVRFANDDLPTHEENFHKRRARKKLRLCRLFRCLLKMGLQGNSIHPSNPTFLAHRAHLAIIGKALSLKPWEPLIELFTDSTGEHTLEGNNAIEARDLEAILEGELQRQTGTPEIAWKQDHKFNEYKKSLLKNADFKHDWKTLKRSFNIRKFQDHESLIRRSKLVERSWKTPGHPNLRRGAERFQTTFDFFCWKWFLYAMRGDEPRPEKLSYTLTPFGTQIFIPGYWSFDKSRDLDWSLISKLHNARGVERQGEKLAENRRHKAAQLRKLATARDEAKRLKLKGDKRMRFLKQAAGLALETDDRQVGRLLKEAAVSLEKEAF